MTNSLAVLKQAFQDAADALGQVEMNVESVAALIGSNGHVARKPPIRRIKGKKIVTVKAYRRSPVVKAFQTHRPSADAPKRPMKISPKRMRQLQQQGKYIGFTRMLSRADKAQVSVVREKEGFLPAIALAKKLAAKQPVKKA